MRYDKITKQAYFETLLKSIMLQNTEKEQSKIKLKFIWLTKNLQRNNNVLTYLLIWIIYSGDGGSKSTLY